MFPGEIDSISKQQKMSKPFINVNYSNDSLDT